MRSNLVSTEWLAENLQDKSIQVIDASWHMPATKRNAAAEFTDTHIPGARFFDLDAGSAPNTTLPHMLPPTEKFAHDMKKLGVSDAKHVVVYDSAGLFSAARLWWMLKVFGHSRVSVLDGGLPKWQRENCAVESGSNSIVDARHFTPHLAANKVSSLDEVAVALQSGSAQIADARSPTRFRGEEAEPRPGVRPGHMPGSHNVHYASLLNADGTLKNSTDLRATFEAAGLNLDNPIITSCGSGVTAAILYLALAELGHQQTSLYDGSWTEWGASDQSVVKGAD
jgi:thiosulfate/3-mercaptopyruvate sulfurtransferase